MELADCKLHIVSWLNYSNKSASWRSEMQGCKFPYEALLSALPTEHVQAALSVTLYFTVLSDRILHPGDLASMIAYIYRYCDAHKGAWTID